MLRDILFLLDCIWTQQVGKKFVAVHSVLVTSKNPCKIYSTNKFVAQMDFCCNRAVYLNCYQKSLIQLR